MTSTSSEASVKLVDTFAVVTSSSIRIPALQYSYSDSLMQPNATTTPMTLLRRCRRQAHDYIDIRATALAPRKPPPRWHPKSTHFRAIVLSATSLRSRWGLDYDRRHKSRLEYDAEANSILWSLCHLSYGRTISFAYKA